MRGPRPPQAPSWLRHCFKLLVGLASVCGLAQITKFCCYYECIQIKVDPLHIPLMYCSCLYNQKWWSNLSSFRGYQKKCHKTPRLSTPEGLVGEASNSGFVLKECDFKLLVGLSGCGFQLGWFLSGRGFKPWVVYIGVASNGGCGFSQWEL